MLAYSGGPPSALADTSGGIEHPPPADTNYGASM